MNEPSTFSDNQRRFVCRIVFLVLCAIPTSVSVYSLFHRPSPEHWQNLVRAQLGIPVQIASVETPVPFTTVLRGVRIPNTVIRSSVELETDLLIDEIRINIGDQQNVVTIVQPLEISARSLSQLVKRCNDHLEQVPFDQKVWRFGFSKIVLTDYENVVANDFAAPPVILQPVLVQSWQERVDGVTSVRCELSAAVDPVGNSEHPMIDMSLTKHRNGDSLKLVTGAGEIPARLLRYWQSDLNWLGNGCKFQGEIFIANSLTGEGTVTGSLQGVELDRLSVPYALGIRGTCDVSDISCSFENNLINSAHMRIHSAQQISVGSALLTACQKLGIQTGPLKKHGDYWFPNIDLTASIEMGRLLFSGRNGSVISSDAEGVALATVHNADVSIYDLASILITDAFDDEAIAFLKRFRTQPRIAREPTEQNSRY